MCKTLSRETHGNKCRFLATSPFCDNVLVRKRQCRFGMAVPFCVSVSVLHGRSRGQRGTQQLQQICKPPRFDVLWNENCPRNLRSQPILFSKLKLKRCAFFGKNGITFFFRNSIDILCVKFAKLIRSHMGARRLAATITSNLTRETSKYNDGSFCWSNWICYLARAPLTLRVWPLNGSRRLLEIFGPMLNLAP